METAPAYDREAYMAMTPRVYLQDGFLQGAQEPQEFGTVYALAMAERLRQDGVALDLLRYLADELKDLAAAQSEGLAEAGPGLAEVLESPPYLQLPILQEWFQAILGVVKDDRSLAALIGHIEAIVTQWAVLEWTVNPVLEFAEADLEIEDHFNEPLTLHQRQAVNEETQQLLLQLSEVETLLHDAPARAVAETARRELKQALGKSQQAVRAERIGQAQPVPVPAADPAGAATGAPLVLNHDLGPPGIGNFVSLGPEIAALQRLLQGLGMDVKASGRFDAGTAKAVRNLQLLHHLTQHNGVVDAETRQLLQRLSQGKP